MDLSFRGQLAACSVNAAGVGAAPSVGTLLYNSCALPVLGYVSQLLPTP